MTDSFTGIIQQLEQRKSAIERALAALQEVEAQVKPTTALEVTTGKRKKFSAAARKRMAAAQKARWAGVKGESETPAPPVPEPPKPKHRITPEGMKRIIAATKKRWRLQRAAARAALTKEVAPRKVTVAGAPSAKTARKGAPVRKVAVTKAAPPAATTETSTPALAQTVG